MRGDGTQIALTKSVCVKAMHIYVIASIRIKYISC